MRLFDKMLTMGSEAMRTASRSVAQNVSPVVFIVDEIARHYYEHVRTVWGSSDFPYARPPWKKCFVEWHQSPFVVSANGIVPMNQSSQLGSIVHFSDSPVLGHNLPPHDCAVGLWPIIFDAETNELRQARAFLWIMNRDGFVLGFFPEDNEVVSDDDLHFFRTLTHVIGLAFTFANCANVKLEDITDECQPRAKLRRRFKIPTVKRYTLNIAGHAAAIRNPSGIETGIKMPFHLCRGHFATYTPERPLFGRHVGRFWISPHTRGSKEVGEVEKDYAVAGSQ